MLSSFRSVWQIRLIVLLALYAVLTLACTQDAFAKDSDTGNAPQNNVSLSSCQDIDRVASQATAAAHPFSIKNELTEAAGNSDPLGAAEARIHLAELALAEGHGNDALDYLNAIEPRAIEHQEIAARVEFGKLFVFATTKQVEVAKESTRRLLKLTSALDPGASVRIDLLAKLAQLYADIPGIRAAEPIKDTFTQVSESLAEKSLPEQEAVRLQSALADIYLAANDRNNGLSASQHAAFRAQQIGDFGLEYKADLAAGDAYVSLHRADDAIRAYEAATNAFSAARAQLIGIAMLDPKGVRHFAGRAYIALADQLLKRSANSDSIAAQRDRQKAIASMEVFKTTELQEFYLTACAPLADARIAPNSKAFVIPDGWIVLYPIVFHDRVEMLSLQSNTITQTTVPQSSANRKLVMQFRAALEQHSTEASGPLSEQIYKLFFDRSLQRAREGFGIVFVPDSWMRNLSIASLRTNNQYLVERFPIVTAPSLQSAFAQRGKDSKADEHRSGLIAGISESVDGYPALPGVAEEVQSVRSTLAPTPTLLLQNAAFTRIAFDTNITNGGFSLVHLATHGEFAGRADASFIVTHDGAMHVDEFTTTLRGLNSGGLDLLVLSACQTATGDDRAALGLGGIAVQVGAKDVLATLWQVNDSASAKLIASFYDAAFKSNLPLPKALQKAQIELIRSTEFAAPDYWAPYLLIGNAQ